MPRLLRLSLIHLLWELPLLLFVLWLSSYVILRLRTEVMLLTEERIADDTVFLMLVRDPSSPAEGRYFAGRKTADGKREGQWRLPFYLGFFQAEYRLPMLARDRYGKLSQTFFPWTMLLTLLAGLASFVLSGLGTVHLFRQLRTDGAKGAVPADKADQKPTPADFP